MIGRASAGLLRETAGVSDFRIVTGARRPEESKDADLEVSQGARHMISDSRGVLSYLMSHGPGAAIRVLVIDATLCGSCDRCEKVRRVWTAAQAHPLRSAEAPTERSHGLR
jgi:hypothetical protein